jgi:DNA topoisomerase-3
MNKSLIIAEKPSVAADVARALGGFTKHDDYFESDQFVLCSAIGHLLELIAPEAYEVKRGKWSFAHLPVLPPHFDLRPIEKTESRLKLLTRLARRKDVSALINACDAGREGELIFSYIVDFSRVKKPIKRLWLQSMTPTAIRSGFESLRDGAEMAGLRDAAMCRSESDWLIGINGTRAMTAFNSKSGGFHLTTVGRVQTPTLAVVVEREEKIRGFSAREYFEVEAQFSTTDGSYTGKWFDPDFKRREGDADGRADRVWERPAAESIRTDCVGKTGVATDESKPSSQLSPALFDLTSLQREANGRFGFSAKNTLGLAQALYEKHKVLTYPRTDARALPEDYLDTVKEVLSTYAGRGGKVDPSVAAQYGEFAGRILDGGWVKPNKRIFDNKKISDHFAIIPTGQLPKNLNEAEQKLYDLVVKRFLAVFFPAAEHLLTTRTTSVGAHLFKTEGKILVNPGWLVIYGREKSASETPVLPSLSSADCPVLEVSVNAMSTRPPARFNEATLLSAMESAGKLVDDEELREAMRDKGLGTPATRAQIIEGLIAEKYIDREGRELVPMPKAFQLFAALRGLRITALCSPEMTGNWEFQLKQMERGGLERSRFMAEIADITRRMVDDIKAHQDDDILGDFAELTVPCPKCGGLIKENYKKFQCQACDYALWKIVSGRQYAPEEVETLLREGKVGPLTGFRSKMGRAFSAMVRLNAAGQPEFAFDNAAGDGDGPGEAIDFSGQTALGACPKCGAAVFEHGSSYLCERSVAQADREKSCDFRSGKVILQQPVENEQMVKLLADGRTDLLKGFVSARTKRKFAAYLVKGKDGKVGFEFEPRAEKKVPAKK